jgi:hypothetical protein
VALVGFVIEPGIYRHYKGKLYEVIGVARHSETQEELVVYRALEKTEYITGALWVSPQRIFEAMVRDKHGEGVPAFTYIEQEPEKRPWWRFWGG